MTADASNQKKSTNTGTLMPAIALVFAFLTIVFAVFSMVLGSRMAKLSHNQMNAQNEAAASETAAIDTMETALQEARQMAEAEKVGAEKLRKQLSATMQEVKKLKADLSKANQAINTLKTKAEAAPAQLPAVPMPAFPQESPSSDPAAAVENKASLSQGTPKTEAVAPRAADIPAEAKEKPPIPTSGQIKSQPQKGAPDSDNQKARLEESTIKPEASANEPLTASEQQAPEAGVSDETAVE